jgi:hypothetical protein
VPGRSRRDDQQAEFHAQEHEHVGVERLKVAHVLVGATVDVQEQDTLPSPSIVLEVLRERVGERERLLRMLRTARWKQDLWPDVCCDLHALPPADLHTADVVQEVPPRQRAGHVRDGRDRGRDDQMHRDDDPFPRRVVARVVRRLRRWSGRRVELRVLLI